MPLGLTFGAGGRWDGWLGVWRIGHPGLGLAIGAHLGPPAGAVALAQCVADRPSGAWSCPLELTFGAAGAGAVGSVRGGSAIRGLALPLELSFGAGGRWDGWLGVRRIGHPGLGLAIGAHLGPPAGAVALSQCVADRPSGGLVLPIGAHLWAAGGRRGVGSVYGGSAIRGPVLPWELTSGVAGRWDGWLGVRRIGHPGPGLAMGVHRWRRRALWRWLSVQRVGHPGPGLAIGSHLWPPAGAVALARCAGGRPSGPGLAVEAPEAAGRRAAGACSGSEGLHGPTHHLKRP